MTGSLLKSRGIFPCTHCGEMIYSDAERCRATDLQAEVNSACNHAKLLRITAGGMWMFLLLSTILFLPFGLGYAAMFLGVPLWLIYWYPKYGRLETPDPDYKLAKRDWKIALFLWIPAVILQVAYFVGELNEWSN